MYTIFTANLAGFPAKIDPILSFYSAFPPLTKVVLGISKKKRTIRMQSTRDVTIRVQSVNKLHGYLNIGDNGTVYFAYYQRS